MLKSFWMWTLTGSSELLIESISTLKDALATVSKLYGATNLEQRY